MDYVNNFLKNVLKHQNFGGMDFEWRDKNLSGIKISLFVF